VSAQEAQKPLSDTKVPDYKLLARMVIREGKTFKESALAAGYSESVAVSGLKRLVADSSPAADAIRKESEAFITLDRLKPLAVQRLWSEITDPKSSLGIKAIEIAGRFKETDWFVKSGGEVSIGVFAQLSEAGSVIDAAADLTLANEP